MVVFRIKKFERKNMRDIADQPIRKFIKKKSKQTFNFFSEEKYRVFSVALIILITILYILVSIYYKNDENNEFTKNIIVEFTGLIFDVILFGVVIGFYDKFTDKKKAIQRYQEEIDDYRGWKSEEASHRIFGTLKRLHKAGIEYCDLNDCFFKNIKFTIYQNDTFDFNKTNLIGSTFENCDLSNTNFRNIDTIDRFSYFTLGKEINFGKITFTKCKMVGTMFSQGIISLVSINMSALDNARFVSTKLTDCSINDSSLNNTAFYDTKFETCTFTNIDFLKADCKNITFSHCDFENCVMPSKKNYKIIEHRNQYFSTMMGKTT